jgi:hypothetical protein
MTPYKLISLYNIHKEFNPDKFVLKDNRDIDGDIDSALGGL